MSTNTPPAQPELPHHETKISIPFPNETNPTLHIVGILAQKSATPFDPSSPSSSSSLNPRPLALIMHGVLAHKDQAYHKLLSKSLSIDSFRFDFRANHETPGDWDMARFENDVHDMDVVLAYLREKLSYELDLLVGHSRGSLIGWSWMAERSKQYNSAFGPILWVSLGGRWRMERIHDRDHIYNEGFKKDGYWIWKVSQSAKHGQP